MGNFPTKRGPGTSVERLAAERAGCVLVSEYGCDGHPYHYVRYPDGADPVVVVLELEHQRRLAVRRAAAARRRARARRAHGEEEQR